MAFSKVSTVLLVLLIVATLADARVDHFMVSSEPETAGRPEPTCSYSCECKIEDGTSKCYYSASRRSNTIKAECPSSCKNLCICDLSTRPTCSCSHEVDSCCGSISPFGAEPKSENLLGLIKEG